MSIEVRTIRQDEVDAHTAQLTQVFWGSRPSELHRVSTANLLEVDRTTAAYDRGAMVASASVISLTMTLPGAVAVPCAGVTRVSVLPTHRRRGILRALMRQQLDAIREQGEPIAALYASQAPIYGRFGYGPATWHAHGTLRRPRSTLRSVPPDRRLRFVDFDEAVHAATAVHDQLAPRHPGAAHRSQPYWETHLVDSPDRREGASDLNHVVAEDDSGHIDGFVSYRLARPASPAGERGSVRVRDLLATTPAAYLVLWRYCAAIDLTSQVEVRDRPLDEPVRMALADPRALQLSLSDGVWVRLVDVADALGSRRYAQAGRLVLRVRDEFCGWNAGSYELESAEDGTAICRRTEAPADLELDAGDLAACFLGGNQFQTLGAALRVAGSPAAIQRADAMFRSAATPWCPTHF